MWRDIAEYIQKLFKVKEQVDQNSSRLASLEEEVSVLSQAVVDLQYQVLKNAADERHEREKLAMRLEIALLRFERQLGTGGSVVPSLSADTAVDSETE
jgi:hypothetical protein